MQAKRKLTALLLSLCMVLGMLPMTVFAAGDTTTSGLNYEINGNSVTITGSAWETANVTIPSEIEGKPVTARVKSKTAYFFKACFARFRTGGVSLFVLVDG